MPSRRVGTFELRVRMTFASVSVRRVQGTPGRALHATDGDGRIPQQSTGARFCGWQSHRPAPKRRALPLRSKNERFLERLGRPVKSVAHSNLAEVWIMGPRGTESGRRWRTRHEISSEYSLC